MKKYTFKRSISNSTPEMIEKGEYIDFDKIKLGTRVRSVLRRPAPRTSNLSPNGVWNTFVVAPGFWPDEHASLLAYQRAIAQFAKTYMFSQVYSYSIDFRKKMAAVRRSGTRNTSS